MKNSSMDILKHLEELVSLNMKEWKVPGTCVAVIKDGSVILNRAFGYRNIKENLETSSDTLFAIASMSKAFTATALGILVDEGKLEWDTPIRNYIPEFELYDDYASINVTPRDLACHRTGLPRHEFMWHGAKFSRREIVDKVRYLEPNLDFRYGYQYQNQMYVVLGYLVERLTGVSWEEFVRNRILKPLGMDNTNFSIIDSVKSPDFAMPYGEKDGEIAELKFKNVDGVGPAGCINSSLNDMIKWFLLNMNKGKLDGKQIISEKSITETYSPQSIINDSTIRFKEIPYLSYGMGWEVQIYRGHNIIQHDGSITGFSAMGAFLPDDDLGVIILTNKYGAGIFNNILLYNIIDNMLEMDVIDWNGRYRELINKFKAIKNNQESQLENEKKENTRPSHSLSEYAGEYIHPGYGKLYINIEGDTLKLHFNEFRKLLKHYHYDVFSFSMEEFGILPILINFNINSRGNISSVSIPMEPAVKDIVFIKN